MSTSLRPISSEIIDLPLVSARAPWARQIASTASFASSDVRQKCTCPPASVTFCLVGFEIKIEMLQRMFLDVARRIAQRLEFRQFGRRERAALDEAGAQIVQSLLQRRVLQRLMRVLFELRRGRVNGHRRASALVPAIGGVSVMPASTSAT